MAQLMEAASRAPADEGPQRLRRPRLGSAEHWYGSGRRVRREAGEVPWEEPEVRVSSFYVVRRVIFLGFALLRLGALFAIDAVRFSLWARFRGQRTEFIVRRARRWRARRLRSTLQRMGGTWVKIGQQLSLRTDVLPRWYCSELEKLLDSGDALEAAYVKGVVEALIEHPLSEVFESFDFEPIGSGSVACVYAARFHDGTYVAVKVRRPDIRQQFEADLKALAWLLRSAEFLTLLRPGQTETFRSELYRMLMDELDFRAERYYQELFRRYLRRWKELDITAPRVLHRMCGNEVITSELVRGLWMKDLLEIVESRDQRGWRRLKEDSISPKRVARQLIQASFYQFYKCPFFHGDPHPANILIQPENRIVMVDFGACGTFSHAERAYLRQMHEAYAKEDVGGMVRAVVHLMEPLPAIDVAAFRAKLEHEWWLGFYGLKSRHSGWQERTSFRLWRALFRLVREFRIPLPLNVLRMMRATLLYDTVAARLYPRLNVFDEYRRYYESQATAAKERFFDSLWRQLFCGPDASTFLSLERLLHTSGLLMNRVENWLNRPQWQFGALVEKGWSLFLTFLKWFVWVGTLTATATLIGVVTLAEEFDRWRQGREIALNDLILADLGGVKDVLLLSWVLLLLLVSFKYLRQIWWRVSDCRP